MLFIVATLEEIRGMLLGANIHVFTDHKNLTFNTLKMQHVLCWHTKIEDIHLRAPAKFSPTTFQGSIV
jgi:hypothetical protein